MTENKFKQYVKKPVIVEAYQTDKEEYIETLEGVMKANKGDWIIRGIKGELYPCKPDVFDETYNEYDNEINIYSDFKEWNKINKRLSKNSRRLIEIEEEYETQSERILTAARVTKDEQGIDVIKEKFGGNNDKTRKKYVEEHLSKLLEEKQELKLQKEEDNRRISYLKRVIDMKIELMKYSECK